MNKQEKNQLIEVLDGMLNENKSFYLADISGLTAEENSSLRRLCYKREVSLQVVKNTLLKKAFEKNGVDFTELYDVLVGNTSIMIADSDSSPAKVIKEFRKKNAKPILKAAHIEESFYIGDDNLSTLANLKSRDELLADIITLLQSPPKNVVSALQLGANKLTGIVNILKEKAEQTSSGEEKSVESSKAEQTSSGEEKSVESSKAEQTSSSEEKSVESSKAEQTSSGEEKSEN